MKVADLQMNQRIQPLDPNRIEKQPGKGADVSKTDASKGFGDVLQEKIQNDSEVRFSSHAIDRLEQRSVAMSLDALSRLNSGLKQVQEKGAQNSLILVDDTAFVVSVKNRTVVTALDKVESANRVFTNIDSVAIV